MTSRPEYRFETGVYRPPSEGGSCSLLVRFTRNCPWNRCTFCSMYKSERFELRSLEEIQADIDAIAAVRDDLEAASRRIGDGGRITRRSVSDLLARAPHLDFHPGLAMVIGWLLAGGRTAFLQDANSLIMKTEDLVQALQYLRRTFPTLERVTSYVRSRTLVLKTATELEAIRKAGLDRVHVGLETGDDELLGRIRKGVTAEGHVQAGKKALAAGFQLSEYWMPGLGGKAMWENHARNTARVLNRIDPHYIRSRPLRTIPGTPLCEAEARNEFEMLSPREQLLELRLMIETLDVTGRVCFDHAGNWWKNRRGGYLLSHDYEGYRFPEQKDQVLALIEEGIQAASR